MEECKNELKPHEDYDKFLHEENANAELLEMILSYFLAKSIELNYSVQLILQILKVTFFWESWG